MMAGPATGSASGPSRDQARNAITVSTGRTSQRRNRAAQYPTKPRAIAAPQMAKRVGSFIRGAAELGPRSCRRAKRREHQEQQRRHSLDERTAEHVWGRRRQHEARAQHAQTVPIHERPPHPGMSRQDQREPRERAERQEQVIEPLIEREQSGRVRLLRRLAESRAYLWGRPPEAL